MRSKSFLPVSSRRPIPFRPRSFIPTGPPDIRLAAPLRRPVGNDKTSSNLNSTLDALGDHQRGLARRAQWVGLVGILVGMAYVVARPKGRFEIRESVHTPNGPRARSLANFATLTDDVLKRARRRASRPFDADAVRAAAARLVTRHPAEKQSRHFVEASRRMARSLDRVPEPEVRQDPGDALIDLLGLVGQIRPFRSADSAPEPLRFPPLARLQAASAAKERVRARAGGAAPQR